MWWESRVSFGCPCLSEVLLARSRLWSSHEMTGQRSRVRLWWARIRQVPLVWEGREAGVEGEGHRELNYTGIIHHFLGHISLTRSQNASFHQTCESAQITCDRILWTASQVIADSGASLVRLTRPRESSPLLITKSWERLAAWVSTTRRESTREESKSWMKSSRDKNARHEP